MKTIEVISGGPIEGTFEIDLSKGPGAYEFRGARGTGKTTCISSIDWLAGHKMDVTLHDGAISGSVRGFGVVAPIGGRKRRKGEFELDTIDAEKFSLTDLVDPPGKTPEVRDAHAIKALAVLSETKADPKLYYDLAGGMAAFDKLGTTSTEDPVLLATRVKQAFDALARIQQNRAEAEAGHAAPLDHVPDDLDMSHESDLTVLGHVRDEARDDAQVLKTAREAGIAKDAEVAKAKERLEKVREEYSGPTVEDALTANRGATGQIATAVATLQSLERTLEKARLALESSKTEGEMTKLTLQAAHSHAEAVEELQRVASITPAYPEECTVTRAVEAVEIATTQYNQGVRIRDVKSNLKRATIHRDAATEAEKAADEARNKAGEVFHILAKSLHTKHLSIDSVDGFPRLFVQHPKRGKTAYDRVNGLSDGERVDFALRELLPHIESPGLLPLPQRVWQDLQPADRAKLHDIAVARGIFLFGAQVDDGDLRIVWLGEEE